ncbi:isopropanol dehydrogenase [Colletotrichum asianum]|uniref:Isopropanol dehydrogenase n=1 Tax=Colletotrichum asianum TaxID=702518 RepID=A0A8H3ZUD1_9PEZI|nr:isopropanol dehydrogenase [Colletotrichum asianum]
MFQQQSKFPTPILHTSFRTIYTLLFHQACFATLTMGSNAPKNLALRLPAFGTPLEKIELPIPEATTGTVVTRVLAAPVVPYTHLAHDGKLPQLNLDQIGAWEREPNTTIPALRTLLVKYKLLERLINVNKYT